jgi:aconitate hydratase
MGVIAKSFARIHLANLINFGIIPLTFKNSDDYDRIAPDDELQLDTAALDSSDLVVKNLTKGIEIPVQHSMTPSEVMRIKAGGTLAYISRHNL